MPEQEVLDRFGPPTRTSPGHYGIVSSDYMRQYDPAWTHKYLADESWIYITVHRNGDQWTCISSHRVPPGTAF